MDSDKQYEMVEVNGVTGMKRGDLISIVVSADRLKPVEWNANEMSDKEYQILVETIRRDGFLDPLSVIPRKDGDFDINGGEHRWKAAIEVGLKDIPCDVLWNPKWQSEDEAQLQSVRYNVIKGKMNPDKFLKLYNNQAKNYGKDKIAGLMGYTSQQGLEKVIKSVAKEMKEALPAEMAEKFDKEAKEARTVGDLKDIINHLFNEYGETVKHSFMVFSYGGREHVYISMDKVTHANMKKLMSLATKKQCDINELMSGAIESVTNRLQAGAIVIDARDQEEDPDEN